MMILDILKNRKKDKEETRNDVRIPDFIAKETRYGREEAMRLVLTGIAMGDIAGSRYEGLLLPNGVTPDTVELYGKGHHVTDDTIISVAVMKAIEEIERRNLTDYEYRIKADILVRYLKAYVKAFPDAGYGGLFYEWACGNRRAKSYNSCGNGSAMRAGIIGAMFEDKNDVALCAAFSASVTHNHPEGIRGAVVAAECVWMCLHGAEKHDIRYYLESNYPDRSKLPEDEKVIPLVIHGSLYLEDLIRLGERYETLGVICQNTVPEAVINFIDSTSYEDCIRNSMRYICDRDTVGAISGGIAAAYYGYGCTIGGRPIEDIAGEQLDEILNADIKV